MYCIQLNVRQKGFANRFILFPKLIWNQGCTKQFQKLAHNNRMNISKLVMIMLVSSAPGFT